jgi:hypothetical protein
MATTKKPTAVGRLQNSKQITNLTDPLDVNLRLYRQIARLLDDIEAADRDERMTMPQRISALIAVGRIQVLFANLRKASINDGSSGSKVRLYSEAFAKTDGVGKRASNPGSSGAGFGDEDDGGGDDA